MSEETYLVGNKHVTLFVPDGDYDTVLYINHTDTATLQEIWSHFDAPSFAMAVITDIDWFSDLTPWPLPTVFDDGPDFAGKAEQHLKYITEEVIPFTESRLKPDLLCRGILGFSLGGLFSVYSLYSSPLFNLIGGVSASMWYEGFTEWMKEHKTLCELASIYFCIGEDECKTQFTRMRCCEDKMKEAYDILDEAGHDITFRYFKGDHLDNVPEKIESAIRWLIGE